ncbi:MAG: metal-dependent transcriptional regulator [Elusimicrobiota bacterium]
MTKKGRKLSPSTEDYLKTVYLLDRDNPPVRVRDISSGLGVSKPSVNQALHVLRDSGLINHENYGYVELTAAGRITAGEIYSRHIKLCEFFCRILDVPNEIAERDACSIEHNISPETMNRLVKLTEYVSKGSGKEESLWQQNFRHFVKTGNRSLKKEKKGR